MDGVANEQDFYQYGDPKIEDDDDYDAATYITRRKRTTLPKKGSPFERRNIKVPGLNYSTATKKVKNIVKRVVEKDCNIHGQIIMKFSYTLNHICTTFMTYIITFWAFLEYLIVF